MAFPDRTRQSLPPSFLYTTSPSLARTVPCIPLPRMMSSNTSLASDLSPKRMVVPSPSEPGRMEMNSQGFYACAVAGLVTGLIRTAATPLDLVKCNMQIDPAKYNSISSGFGVVLKEQGMRGFFRGWVPTLLGYSARNACMLGLLDFFTRDYPELTAPEKTMINLAGSASAVAFGCVVQCPMEAVKVRVQTQPGFARGLSDGFPKFVQSEGVAGLYKGLVPLWGRHIPYAIMTFASLEFVAERRPKPKSQLGVSFAALYIGALFSAVVSHPFDNLVSFLNNAKGATVGEAVRKLGWWGLFTRGLPLRVVMTGTLTVVLGEFCDALEAFAGSTTGGAAPPSNHREGVNI